MSVNTLTTPTSGATNPTNTTSDQIKAVLIHVGILAALGAGVVLIPALIAWLTNANFSTLLPPALAVYGSMIVPLVVSALQKVQAELKTQLAQEQAAVANAQVSALQAKLLTLTPKSKK